MQHSLSCFSPVKIMSSDTGLQDHLYDRPYWQAVHLFPLESIICDVVRLLHYEIFLFNCSRDLIKITDSAMLCRYLAPPGMDFLQ